MKSLNLNLGGNGDNPLGISQPGRKVRVVALSLSFSGSVNAKFTDGAAGTLLAGPYYGAANAHVELQPMPPRQGGGGQQGHFETSAGNDLVLNLSAGTAVGGHVVYELVP